MAKLKNVILQLEEKDYRAIFEQLLNGSAEKSAFLLKFLKEDKFSDSQIMDKLEVNSNAYYTLRSRLNQKIEEYLLQQLENPRADLLMKVAKISEVVYTKNKTIAIATLKKLERELLDYDLSLQLTTIYKYLKKLHIGTDQYYEYSQLYNRHVAYMLALDKSEATVNEYFYNFGLYYLSKDPGAKISLDALLTELINNHKLYESHRLYIYRSLAYVAHKLFVDPDFEDPAKPETIEKVFEESEAIFEEYFIDTNYYHIKEVFEHLKFIYYTSERNTTEAEKYLESVNKSLSSLSENFGYFISPGMTFFAKTRYAQMTSTSQDLKDEALEVFHDYRPDPEKFADFLAYFAYRSLIEYMQGQFNSCSLWLNQMLNELGFKNHTLAHMEIKLFLALQYALLDEYDLFHQIMNSLLRQLRIAGEDDYPSLTASIKIVKIIGGKSKKNIQAKLEEAIAEYEAVKIEHFSVFELSRPKDLLKIMQLV